MDARVAIREAFRTVDIMQVVAIEEAHFSQRLEGNPSGLSLIAYSYLILGKKNL